MAKQIKNLTIACIGLFLIKGELWAAEQQSIASIRSAAKNFLAEQSAIQRLDAVEIQPGRLDPRLRLPLCDDRLAAFLPAGGKLIGKTSVGVRCTGNAPWTLYVPVTVTAYAKVPTVNYAMPRGTVLTADDISLVRLPLHQLPVGHLTNIGEVIGMELKRTIQPGKPLTNRMIAAPKIIKRGQQVTLIAKSDNFEVRMNGKAMADGAIGDRIRVQNLSSKKMVEGTVDQNGTIIVDL